MPFLPSFSPLPAGHSTGGRVSEGRASEGSRAVRLHFLIVVVYFQFKFLWVSSTLFLCCWSRLQPCPLYLPRAVNVCMDDNGIFGLRPTSMQLALGECVLPPFVVMPTLSYEKFTWIFRANVFIRKHPRWYPQASCECNRTNSFMRNFRKNYSRECFHANASAIISLRIMRVYSYENFHMNFFTWNFRIKSFVLTIWMWIYLVPFLK